ncbi:MAG TPA: helix-turn-helix domain-containing protein [Ilumatobacteraceae bacterium]|nr:helix-turn-helix domain-containing protein [Ilumatobacteraceae bacterium]
MAKPTRSTPRGRDEVTDALLTAAQRLMAERGPSNVPLRDVAEAAGVNFGLIYRYLGTKEDLLRAVYQRVSQRSAGQMEAVDDLADAVASIVTTGDSGIGRTMAWAALEGDYPADVFGQSAALDHIALLAARQRGTDVVGEDDRLLAGFLLMFALSWRLFSAIGLSSAGLNSADAKRFEPRVLEWIQRFTETAVSPADEPRPRPQSPPADSPAR